MTNSTVDEATDAAVVFAAQEPDSWIAVSDEVNRLIERGATLPQVITVIGAARTGSLLTDTLQCLQPQCSGRLRDVTVVDATSHDYPAELRVVDGRPLLLYIKGNLPATEKPSLAIVGSRRASSAGRTAAYEIAATVARAGHTIVSGLAEGIDTAAHRGALAAHGITVAVMGTGIDHVFPTSNAALADQIAATGAVVTQFAPGQGPSKTTFPARNRLIAALSNASLLVELNERSGTRIEAERALEQGRPVWLWAPIMGHTPWAQDFAQRKGVNFVTSIDDILRRLDR